VYGGEYKKRATYVTHVTGGEAVRAQVVYERLIQSGVILEANGDRLRYRAPAGALTPELKRELVAHKAELLAMLQSETQPTVAKPAPPPEPEKPDRLATEKQTETSALPHRLRELLRKAQKGLFPSESAELRRLAARHGVALRWERYETDKLWLGWHGGG